MLSVVDCLRAMSFVTHVSFELKDLNYDSFCIQIVPCIPTTFNGDILFELRLLLVSTITLVKFKEWTRNMMGVRGTRLKQLTSITIST